MRLSDFKDASELLGVVKTGQLFARGHSYSTQWIENPFFPIIDAQTSRHRDPIDWDDMDLYIVEEVALSKAIRFGLLRDDPSTDPVVSINTSAKEALHYLILSQDWFKKMFPNFINPRISFELVEGRGGQAVEDEHLIKIDPSLNDPDKDQSIQFIYMVHELTHLLVRRPYECHGRLFRHTLLWLWLNIETTSYGWLLGSMFYSKGWAFTPHQKEII